MHRLFQEQRDTMLFTATFLYTISTLDCMKLKSQIKIPGVSDQDKAVESAMFVPHLRRARKFYDLISVVDETYTITADRMRNPVLPLGKLII